MKYILVNLKVLMLVFGLLYTNSASALLVELQLGGKIIGIKNNITGITSPFDIDDLFSIRMIYTTHVVGEDSFPRTLGGTRYRNAIQSYDVSIGDFNYRGDIGDEKFDFGHIYLNEGYFGPRTIRVSQSIKDNVVNDLDLLFPMVDIYLIRFISEIYFSGTDLTDDYLPKSFNNVSTRAWGAMEILFITEFEKYEIDSSIESISSRTILISEPSILLLMIFSLFLIRKVIWKKLLVLMWSPIVKTISSKN